MSRVLQTGENQITQKYGGSHGGIDIVKKTNQLDGIIAHSGGTVVFCQSGYGNKKGASGNASYGNCVKIKHSNGWSTLYAHLDYVSVKYGQTVQKGEKIGYMGNTGNSYGAHLHFEVRDKSDNRINPEPYINADLPNMESENVDDSTDKTVYKTGTYVVKAKDGSGFLNVREKPSPTSKILKFEELTENAQAIILKVSGQEIDGYIDGMVCDVFEINGDYGRTPSGWVYMDWLVSKNSKSTDEIAKEVIAGKWGDGAERKKKLTSAGYDVEVIQTRVNELVD